MRMSRRKVLFGGGAVLALLGGAGLLYRGALEAHIREVIETVFGAGPAASEAARAFTEDLISGLPGSQQRRLRILSVQHRLGDREAEWFPREISRLFAQSTNVVRASETGETLEYYALFDPYAGPCSNMLSAQWLDA